MDSIKPEVWENYSAREPLIWNSQPESPARAFRVPALFRE